MDRTLKAFSLILSYPSRELQAAMPSIGTERACCPNACNGRGPRGRIASCSGPPCQQVGAFAQLCTGTDANSAGDGGNCGSEPARR